jgi:hypothetical protein
MAAARVDSESLQRVCCLGNGTHRDDDDYANPLDGTS